MIVSIRLLPPLIRSDLRSRWSGGILTWGWALLQPAAQIALYGIVFGALMTPRGGIFSSPGEYIVYLCAGVFCWLGLSETMMRGAASHLEGASLIKGRAISPVLFPLRTACTAWLLAMVGFFGTLAIAPFAGVFPKMSWLLLPVPIVSLILFSAGVALALAPITALARDTTQILHMLLPLGFWATPIVYEPAILPTWAQQMQMWNPLVPAFTTIHCLLLGGDIPPAPQWLLMALLSLAALATGAFISRHLESEVRDAL